jgi:hypothetical protein
MLLRASGWDQDGHVILLGNWWDHKLVRLGLSSAWLEQDLDFSIALQFMNGRCQSPLSTATGVKVDFVIVPQVLMERFLK